MRLILLRLRDVGGGGCLVQGGSHELLFSKTLGSFDVTPIKHIALMAFDYENTYDFVMDDARGILPHLPVLSAFAEMESVTGAADILGMPQPQVSRTLSKIEESTGLVLRQRDGRSVIPTKAALELGRAAQSTLTALNNSLATLRGGIRGQVRLAFQHSLGEDLVPRAISDFVPDHPGVEFSLTQGSRDDCLNALESGRADVAFVAVIPDSLAVTATLIKQEELALAVPLHHSLAGRDSVGPEDIRTEPLIAPRRGLGLRRTTDAILDRWQIRPRIAFEGQEVSTVLGLVAAGLGVAIVPIRRHREDIALVRFTQRDAFRDLVLVTQNNRTLSTAAEAFVSSIRRPAG